jgi:hypothetical protein
VDSVHICDLGSDSVFRRHIAIDGLRTLDNIPEARFAGSLGKPSHLGRTDVFLDAEDLHEILPLI